MGQLTDHFRGLLWVYLLDLPMELAGVLNGILRSCERKTGIFSVPLIWGGQD